MLKLITTVLFCLVCFGCSSKPPPDLKSPCVAIESPEASQAAPCARRSVNNNWLS